MKTSLGVAIIVALLSYAQYATAENHYTIRSGLPYPTYDITTVYYPPRLFTTDEFRNTSNGLSIASAVEPTDWDKMLAEIDKAFVELSQCLASIPEFEFGEFVIKPHPITKDELELLKRYPIVLRLIPFLVGGQEAAGVVWLNSHIEVGVNTFPHEFRNDLKHEWLHLLLDVRLGKLYKMESLGPFAHHQILMKKCTQPIDRSERKVGGGGKISR